MHSPRPEFHGDVTESSFESELCSLIRTAQQLIIIINDDDDDDDEARPGRVAQFTDRLRASFEMTSPAQI